MLSRKFSKSDMMDMLNKKDDDEEERISLQPVAEEQPSSPLNQIQALKRDINRQFGQYGTVKKLLHDKSQFNNDEVKRL